MTSRFITAFVAFGLVFGMTLAVSSDRNVTAAAEPVATKSQSPAKPKSKRRVISVGPNHEFKTPSQAAKFARHGDHIKIDAGAYQDCAVWRASRLLIEGVGGHAHVKDISCQGKGIWVIKGNNIRIRKIEFSGADVPHNNGAGIRFEGRNLSVRDSYFHGNENGILTGKNLKSRIFITNSRFERNGKCAPDCAHGIYIGKIRELRITGSKFHNQKVGHHIKSRALMTRIIGNRIVDGPRGTSSMSINLPWGGNADIRSNHIEQGPRAENYSVMISIGEEGNVNRGAEIVFRNNYFVNTHRRSTTFIRNRTRTPVILRANRFQGKGRRLQGAGRVDR